MSKATAFIGATIFDGYTRHHNKALVVMDGVCGAILDPDDIAGGIAVTPLDGGLLAPGFIDLQVNGGGGCLFNSAPNLDSIVTICRAHAEYGTTSLLPTLITDTLRITERAIEAGIRAFDRGIPGFLGLHLEGPHLSTARKGAHSPELIRPMMDEDVTYLCQVRTRLPHLMITIAPESVNNHQILALCEAGITVSLGHSNASAEQARQAFSAGACCVTHLYNAMSPLAHREPGLVGAALNAERVFAGLIADGHHVRAEAIDIALKCKSGEGKLFLVSDAMSTIGSD